MTASFTHHIADDQRALAPWLVVATDRFMSGRGMAKGTVSYAAWACRDEHEAKLVTEYLATRDEMKRVRTVYDGKRTYAPKSGLVSVYDAAKVDTVRSYRAHKACDESRKARAEYSAACEVERVMRSLEVCRMCGGIVPTMTHRPTAEALSAHMPTCEYVAKHGGVS